MTPPLSTPEQTSGREPASTMLRHPQLTIFTTSRRLSTAARSRPDEIPSRAHASTAYARLPICFARNLSLRSTLLHVSNRYKPTASSSIPAILCNASARAPGSLIPRAAFTARPIGPTAPPGSAPRTKVLPTPINASARLSADTMSDAVATASPTASAQHCISHTSTSTPSRSAALPARQDVARAPALSPAIACAWAIATKLKSDWRSPFIPFCASTASSIDLKAPARSPVRHCASATSQSAKIRPSTSVIRFAKAAASSISSRPRLAFPSFASFLAI